MASVLARRRSRPNRRSPHETARDSASIYSDTLRKHKRHVLAVRIAAGLLSLVAIVTVLRVWTRDIPAPVPREEGVYALTLSAAEVALGGNYTIVKIVREAADSWQLIGDNDSGRCLQVRVITSGDLAEALKPFMAVGCPARVDAKLRLGGEAEPGSAVEQAVSAFIVPYLTGKVSFEREVTEGAIEDERVPYLPQPFQNIDILTISSYENDSGATIAWVTVSAAGDEYGYRLVLVPNESGQLLVDELQAGPPIESISTIPATTSTTRRSTTTTSR